MRDLEGVHPLCNLIVGVSGMSNKTASIDRKRKTEYM
jgi:hypothetical protein